MSDRDENVGAKRVHRESAAENKMMPHEAKVRCVETPHVSTQEAQRHSENSQHGAGAFAVQMPVCKSQDRTTRKCHHRYVSSTSQTRPKEGSSESGDLDMAANLPQQLFFQDSMDAVITPEMANWRLSVNNISLLHILQADIQCVGIRTGPVRGNNPSDFFDHMKNVSFKQNMNLDEAFPDYLTDLCKALVFDVPDCPMRKNLTYGDCKPVTLYDGYSADENRKVQVIQQLRKSHQNVLALFHKLRTNDEVASDFLATCAAAAFKFIRKVTNFIRHPVAHAEQAYEHLFSSLAELVGLEYIPASSYPTRKMTIYGKQVHGTANLRSHFGPPSPAFFNGIDVHDMARVRILPVTSVVEVKDHALNTDDPKEHISLCLAQLLAEMLAELRASDVPENVGRCSACTYQEIVGVAVMSTRVQFVLLRYSDSVAELYNRKPSECFEDEDREKAVIYITDWLDFMKRDHRSAILHMLQKISIMKGRPIG